MQRREQQKRAAAGLGGGGGSSYLGGSSGYSAVPRFEAPEITSPRTTPTPVSSIIRPPSFKGSGMKLGSKRTKQAELLDALGGEAIIPEEMPVSIPQTPVVTEPTVARRDTRGSLPVITQER